MRVADQDALLEHLELGSRLHAQLVDQHPADSLVGRQRIGLAAAAVEGEHQVLVQPLAQRELSDQGLQVRHGLLMAVQVQMCFQPPFLGLEAYLLQPRHLAAA